MKTPLFVQSIQTVFPILMTYDGVWDYLWVADQLSESKSVRCLCFVCLNPYILIKYPVSLPLPSLFCVILCDYWLIDITRRRQVRQTSATQSKEINRQDFDLDFRQAIHNGVMVFLLKAELLICSHSFPFLSIISGQNVLSCATALSFSRALKEFDIHIIIITITDRLCPRLDKLMADLFRLCQ